MGDECTCEKCRGNQVYSQGGVCWPLESAEAAGEGRVRTAHEHFIVVGERGIALRRKAAEA
ncbi:MAG TPA: hypothetical protein VNZ44_04795 [Pyrinomonadaceae bacterium]|nr:hypothetical protein [Pyrinomonadaceae bacterium]